ncbi:SirB2 family protein [Alkalisalibacterium limincola]|jgi:uncharacterized membrane protein SirB2|uniref:SirB2 family protein n=1 Tax=Alkalisalibacterium limincola TaxID=2699169 RepID=A0A5C8KH99_9GAMM|nr:SirB2 family protein [Alkalisalibacterium limincola]TXK59810.1 hypothetical protein FU658_12710 [Alkalisalibacterium limincola]
MIEFYPQIKQAHVGFVLLSGGLFALRGLLLLAGQRWANARPIRWLSYTIDTGLLTAALMLLVALKLNPFVVPWLAVKLVLLVVYVVLGYIALKRARGWPRVAWYAAALACFGFMYTVARAHHPLGLFAEWLA